MFYTVVVQIFCSPSHLFDILFLTCLTCGSLYKIPSPYHETTTDYNCNLLLFLSIDDFVRLGKLHFTSKFPSLKYTSNLFSLGAVVV